MGRYSTVLYKQIIQYSTVLYRLVKDILYDYVLYEYEYTTVYTVYTGTVLYVKCS